MIFMLYNCSCIDDDISCSMIFYDDIVVVIISKYMYIYMKEKMCKIE